MRKTYDIGDVVRLYGDFTSGGGPVLPSNHICEVIRPDGQKDEVTLLPVGDGRLEGAYEPELPGVYEYRIAGLAGFKAAGEHSFAVRKQRVT
jgi:hypothetical protein